MISWLTRSNRDCANCQEQHRRQRNDNTSSNHSFSLVAYATVHPRRSYKLRMKNKAGARVISRFWEIWTRCRLRCSQQQRRRRGVRDGEESVAITIIIVPDDMVAIDARSLGVVVTGVIDRGPFRTVVLEAVTAEKVFSPFALIKRLLPHLSQQQAAMPAPRTVRTMPFGAKR